jgi:cell wall-associated NlpC family hydrolase
MAAGSVLLYAGLKGYSIPATLQDIITGKSPLSQAQATPVSGDVTAAAAATTAGGGSALANDAVSYVGHCYLYGGAPGTSGKGCWDCSSFMNWVVGHDGGMAIPGYAAGAYDGAEHGPSTLSWLLFGTGISAANAESGDLIVGETHMGMVTTPGNYVSAHDPAEGTTVSAISTFPDPVHVYRRVAGTAAVPSG